jgi:hypothetical protein
MCYSEGTCLWIIPLCRCLRCRISVTSWSPVWNVPVSFIFPYSSFRWLIMLLLHQPEQSQQMYLMFLSVVRQWRFLHIFWRSGLFTRYRQCLLCRYLCFFYLLTFWVAENMLCQMVGSVTDNELEMTWKKAWRNLNYYYSIYLKLWGKTRAFSIRSVCGPKFQTRTFWIRICEL